MNSLLRLLVCFVCGFFATSYTLTVNAQDGGRNLAYTVVVQGCSDPVVTINFLECPLVDPKKDTRLTQGEGLSWVCQSKLCKDVQRELLLVPEILEPRLVGESAYQVRFRWNKMAAEELDNAITAVAHTVGRVLFKRHYLAANWTLSEDADRRVSTQCASAAAVPVSSPEVKPTPVPTPTPTPTPVPPMVIIPPPVASTTFSCAVVPAQFPQLRFTRTYEYGAVSKEVKELQLVILAPLGLLQFDPAVDVPGRLGTKTMEGIRRLQGCLGLPVTGSLDLATINRLFGGLKPPVRVTGTIKVTQRAAMLYIGS